MSINAAVSEIEVGHSLILIANVTGSAEKPVWSIEEKDPSSMDAEIDQNGVLNSGSVPGKVTVKASIEGISDEVLSFSTEVFYWDYDEDTRCLDASTIQEEDPILNPVIKSGDILRLERPI